jgi:hypothetical protein
MKKYKFGDIFYIKNKKTTVVIQFVEDHKTFGSLVRVLSKHKGKIKQISDIQLDLEKELFVLFFPLAAAIQRKIAVFLTNDSKFKFTIPRYMRSEHYTKNDGFTGWEIHDLQESKMHVVKSLDKETIKFSPWGIWNDTLLLEVAESEWSLGTWTGETEWGL